MFGLAPPDVDRRRRQCAFKHLFTWSILNNGGGQSLHIPADFLIFTSLVTDSTAALLIKAERVGVNKSPVPPAAFSGVGSVTFVLQVESTVKKE